MIKKVFELLTISLLLIGCSFSETETSTGTIINLSEEDTGTKITIKSTVETDFYDTVVFIIRNPRSHETVQLDDLVTVYYNPNTFIEESDPSRHSGFKDIEVND